MHRLAAVLVVTGVFFSGLTLRVGLAGGPAPLVKTLRVPQTSTAVLTSRPRQFFHLT